MRARLVGALLLALLPGTAFAGDLLDKPLLPDQFFGVMLRIPAGAYVGDGMNKVAQPSFGYGASLQFRVLHDVWLDLAYDQRIPVESKPPAGGYLLGLDSTTLGLRGRFPTNGSTNVLAELAAGGAALHVLADQDNPTTSGFAASGMLGLEKQVAGSGPSGAYVGVELQYEHFLTSKDKIPFQGGMIEARAAFSYYFGGDEARECW